MTALLCEFNKILEEEKIVKVAYQSTEISDSIKKTFLLSGINFISSYSFLLTDLEKSLVT